jgi:hypothetical protein
MIDDATITDKNVIETIRKNMKKSGFFGFFSYFFGFFRIFLGPNGQLLDNFG